MPNRVGFTGSRFGMKQAQLDNLYALLREHRPEKANHGMCMGSDAVFHRVCNELGIPVIGHPPIITKRMMKYDPASFLTIMASLPYHDRDREIVHGSDWLVATPNGPEQLRSGTWATIRYSAKMQQHQFILWPDGRIEERSNG